MKITESNVNRLAVIVYTGGALATSGVFLLATLIGDYDWVARIGGAAWVFLLSMIILMPTVTPFLRERAGIGSRPGTHH